jgi:chorismate dehydratase
MNGQRRPRVGHIEFLNCLPLYWGLMRSGALLGVDLHKDTPDRLSLALIDGGLDIGPISLVEYLRHVDHVLLLPDLAVGSDGPVLSVNLVSKVPLPDLDGRRVALGSNSRTGVLLARMLLESRYGVRPEYEAGPPDLRSMLSDADAAVLIGDPALRARHEAPAQGLLVTDLGQEWRDWTGLPMVFAVWAVRRDFAAAHPGVVKEVHDAFLESRRLCLDELDAAAEAAARWEPFSAETLAAYFRTLDFSLAQRQVAGLREFAARAAAAGEVPPLPPDGPEFVSV